MHEEAVRHAPEGSQTNKQKNRAQVPSEAELPEEILAHPRHLWTHRPPTGVLRSTPARRVQAVRAAGRLRRCILAPHYSVTLRTLVLLPPGAIRSHASRHAHRLEPKWLLCIGSLRNPQWSDKFHRRQWRNDDSSGSQHFGCYRCMRRVAAQATEKTTKGGVQPEDSLAPRVAKTHYPTDKHAQTRSSASHHNMRNAKIRSTAG